MGKAARAKRNREPRDRRAEEAERAVRAYMSRIGAPQGSNAAQVWATIETKAGLRYADELEAEIDRRNAGARDDRIYDLLYRDLDAAIATLPLLAPMARTWLTHVARLDLPSGDLLDLGSGSGIHTCFYATMRPEHTVVGVDQHPAAVACAQALASRLQLTNVTFLHAGVEELDLGRRFSVVTSTAIFAEIDGTTPPSTVPFSTLASGRELFTGATSRLAESASRHVDDDGVYLSLERLTDFVDLARWTGALNAAALVPDLAATEYLSWNAPVSGPESMPAVIATRRGTPPGFGELRTWRAGQPPSEEHDDFHAENRLATSRELEFQAGVHFDIQDEHGSGMTRIYALTADDRALTYMTTSRGARRVMTDAPDHQLATALDGFGAIVEAFTALPTVVGQRELGASDLLADLDRP
jgi:tRNA G46 methylase TrmB